MGGHVQLSYLPSPLWDEFYYITHVDNLASIAARGLLSHNAVAKLPGGRVDLSNPKMQDLRARRIDPVYSRSIHDYVPLYVNPKNSMLSVRRDVDTQVVVLRIGRAVLEQREHLYTDGNAALANTKIGLSHEVGLAANEALCAPYWKGIHEGARRRMAEVLIFPDVPHKFIHGFLVKWPELLAPAQERLGVSGEVSMTTFF